MITVERGYKKEFVRDMGVILALIEKVMYKYRSKIDKNGMRRIEEMCRIVKEILSDV